MIQLRFTKTKGLWLLIVVTECFKVIEGGELLYTIPMQKEHEQEWVDVHNEYRRLVSNPEASNMRLMTWDYGLAQLAKTVVSTCDFTHTSLDAMATSLFPEAGENLYAGSFEFSAMIRGITKLWYDEIEFYNHTQATCDENKECGHYTQVVWAVTYKIGCAVGRCKTISNGGGSYLVACNYGPTGNKYLEGTRSPPYESGESCSNCGEGDGCIDQLCNNTARDIPLSGPEVVASSSETDSTNIVCYNGTCVMINATFPTATSAATITTPCDFVNIVCFFLSGLLLTLATA